MPPSSIGALVSAVRRRIVQKVMERAAHHQISALQFWTVIATQESPGISQVELSARTLADTASTSRALSSLCRRGLMDVAPDPQDRRRSRVRLTPAGDRLALQLAPLARELREALARGMSAAEVGSLCASLRRVIANLDDLGEPPGPVEPGEQDERGSRAG